MDPGGFPRSWPGRSGAACGSPSTASGASWSASASTPAPSAWPWSRANATPTNAAPSFRRPSATSTPSCRARRSSSTACTSVGSPAPRAPSAIHRDRRRLRPHLGRAARHRAQPRSRHTRELLHRVAAELAHAGWKLQEVPTDNGSEFRALEFGAAVEDLGARQRFIRAGRPNSNGCVERVQLTILEECWRPTFARSLVPKSSALKQDLDEYLTSTTLTAPRAPDPTTRARRHRLRRTQDEHHEMKPNRRYISGLGRSSRSPC